MTEFGDSAGAGWTERIGSLERDAAISALAVHREAGRLDSAEFEDRQVIASRAQTWGEVAPLFADLPEPRPAKVSTLAAYGPPPGTRVPPAGSATPVGNRLGIAIPERLRETIMSLTPFAALVLFFTTDTWLWFLMIPVMGILLYGGEGRPGRKDRRSRR